MAEVVRWKQGDTAAKPWVIRDGDGNPLDISAASVVIYVYDPRRHKMKVSGQTLTITSGVNGECEYAWQAADVDTPGVYEGELVATIAGRPLSTEVFTLEIQPSVRNL